MSVLGWKAAFGNMEGVLTLELRLTWFQLRLSNAGPAIGPLLVYRFPNALWIGSEPRKSRIFQQNLGLEQHAGIECIKLGDDLEISPPLRGRDRPGKREVSKHSRGVHLLSLRLFKRCNLVEQQGELLNPCRVGMAEHITVQRGQP